MGDIDLASELAVALAELSEAPQHVASPCPHACAESAVLAVALVEPSEAPEFGAAQWPQPLLCPAAGAVAHSALPLEPPAKEEETPGGPEALLVSGQQPGTSSAGLDNGLS